MSAKKNGEEDVAGTVNDTQEYLTIWKRPTHGEFHVTSTNSLLNE